jgi:hypothetical protein
VVPSNRKPRSPWTGARIKKIGVRLDTPVEDRTFSAEYTKLWTALTKAHHDFMFAVSQYVTGPRSGSRGAGRLFQRRFVGLKNQMEKSDGFVARLGNSEAEQDREECQIMAYFLAQRALPFVRFWDDTIAATAEGRSITFQSGDIPPWYDEGQESAR